MRRQVVPRLVVACAVLAVAVAGPSLSFVVGQLGQGCVAAANGPSVAVVVDFGDVSGKGTPPGGVVTRCVAHPGSLTGAQALKDAGFVLRFQSGGLLCAINGYPADGCGERTGERQYLYWSYWKAAPGEDSWGYSGAGAAVKIRDGATEGWRFVLGSGSPNDPKPRHAPDHLAICGPLTAPPSSGSSPGAPGAPSDGDAPPASGDPATDDAPTPASDSLTDPSAGDPGATTPDATGQNPNPSDVESPELAFDETAATTDTGENNGGLVGVLVVVGLVAVLGAGAVVRSRRDGRSELGP